MEIRKVSINSIAPAGYNPRADLKPGDPEYEKLLRSMTEFGFVEPLVWNERTGNLVGGHQRFKILQAQGVTEVEVSVVDLPLEKEKALNIALNKVQGAWDEEKLAALLQELSSAPDFDVLITGFDQAEISGLFDECSVPDFDDEGENQEPDGPVITKRGDLIQLGDHRLLCGDCTSSSDLKTLLGDQMIDLWYSDFPYGVSYSAGQRPTKKRGKSKWKKIANDDLNGEKYDTFLESAVRSLCPFLTSGAPVYLWNGFAKMGFLNDCLEKEGFHVSSLITWVKPTPSPSFGDYNWQSEYCSYGWKEGDGAHKWYGASNESNVWEVSRDSAASLIHPTQKPLELAQRAMKNSSKRGDRVFDGFAGSGSAVIAAQVMERVCFAMELEPRYCDAIVRRYIKTFGHESVSPELYQRYCREV